MSAIEKQKTGYSLRFRPLGKQVRVHVPVETKEQVVGIRQVVERACRSGQFSRLSGLEDAQKTYGHLLTLLEVTHIRSLR
jgi:hypothetical protein